MKLNSRKRLINIYDLRPATELRDLTDSRGRVSQTKLQNLVNRLLFERDLGICARCGMNCLDLWTAIAWYEDHAVEGMAEMWEVCRAIGVRASTWPARLWQGDHIVPVAHGGPTTLENLQTLCLACHGKKSGEDRKPRTFGKGNKVAMCECQQMDRQGLCAKCLMAKRSSAPNSPELTRLSGEQAAERTAREERMTKHTDTSHSTDSGVSGNQHD